MAYSGPAGQTRLGAKRPTRVFARAQDMYVPLPVLVTPQQSEGEEEEKEKGALTSSLVNMGPSMCGALFDR